MKERTADSPSAKAAGHPFPGEHEYALVGWRTGEAGTEGTLDRLNRDLSDLSRQAAEAADRLQSVQSKQGSDTEKMLLSLLEVMDAFERVLGRMHSKRDEMDKQVKKWFGNFRTIFRMLNGVLDERGVSRIENLEDGFDPHWHKAAEVVEDPSRPDGTIVGTNRAGYFWRGKVLRKADVVVVRNEE